MTRSTLNSYPPSSLWDSASSHYGTWRPELATREYLIIYGAPVPGIHTVLVPKMKPWDVFMALLLHLSLTVCADHQPLTIALQSPPSAFQWKSDAEPLDRLATLVEATKARVAALKTGSIPRRHPDENFAESVYPHSYGGYSISLSLGTPPQELSAIMDTGSDLVWVPCTSNYKCRRCTATGDSHPSFLPAKSSSVGLASCANPNCKSLYGNRTEELCFAKGQCAGALKNCGREACPAYGLEYGKGTTEGFLLSETLTLASEDGARRGIARFGVGCSLISTQQPSGIGIAGFGIGGLSLPSQLGSVIGDKFGYCLLNHIYDNQNRSSTMVLGNDAVPKGVRLQYTPFLKNRNAQNSAYGVYYYVGLCRISIGRKFLRLPSELLGFDPKGNGGTIVDSGTTFSFADEKIFDEIAGGFDSQVAYGRAKAIEAKTGFGLCYDVSGHDTISVPQFTFHFKGGSRMSLGLENYWIFAGNAICLTILNTHDSVLNGELGPAVILGNYQQQNFYIVYDREKNRLGFRQQTCEPSG